MLTLWIRQKLDVRALFVAGSSQTASLRCSVPESEPSLSAFLQDELESTAESRPAPASVDRSQESAPTAALKQAEDFAFRQQQACNDANESSVFSFWPQGALLCTA